MSEITLRPMAADDWSEVADLICLGTNYWYQTHGMGKIFGAGPESARLFCEVYETLDPGHCILAVNPTSGRIMGSCFYHPRETHVSLGIMNVHPNYFGHSIARKLLNFVVHFSEQAQKPLRLVSSALNLDSFSLYTRAGFVPRQVFQDMLIKVPERGLMHIAPGTECVRPATPADVDAITALEFELNHISRRQDYQYFIENKAKIWHVSVYENLQGALDGFLVSVQHSGSNMLGPGAMRTSAQAAALIQAELNQNRGRAPVFLVPVDQTELVQTMYRWGAQNYELHFAQVLGEYKAPTGIFMPSFMPETA
ncbi:hypothetical protein BH10CHL1_BH10CHL1_45500 [soil metagenome]